MISLNSSLFFHILSDRYEKKTEIEPGSTMPISFRIKKATSRTSSHTFAPGDCCSKNNSSLKKVFSIGNTICPASRLIRLSLMRINSITSKSRMIRNRFRCSIFCGISVCAIPRTSPSIFPSGIQAPGLSVCICFRHPIIFPSAY